MIDFGTVMETETDSVQVTVKYSQLVSTISSSSPISITNILLWGDSYNNPVFSISPQLNFPILLNFQDSVSFWVKFKPVHNILNNGELLVINNGMRGHLRIDLRGQGHFSNTYYNSTENLSEEALKTALKTKLALGYTSLGYSPARDQMFMTLDNQKFNGQGATVNTLECVYTGVKVTGYTSRADAQNQGFNTEHTFPQSFFSSNEPMLSDLFHIFPTESNVNNVRGNSPFGTVLGTGGQVGGGSQFSGGVFEPRDVHKGRCARAMMYFSLRYQDYSCFFKPQEDTLVAWHKRFPPDNIELGRNAGIFAVQHNRNPFIDYPQFSQRINKITSCTVSDNQHADYFQPDNNIYFGVFTSSSTITGTYYFSVVNTGNLPYQITNISLFNGSYFELINGTDIDTVVNPRETHQFQVYGGSVPFINSIDTLYYTLTPPLPFNAVDVVVPIKLDMWESIENSLQVPYQLYPNPVNKQLNLKTVEKAQLSLWNLIGQEQAIEVDTDGEQYTIDTKNLVEGIYFLHIQVGDKGTYAKVVVKH